MTRGGSRENAGRKTGKTHKKVLISLPLSVAEWLESKENKSGFISKLVEEKMKTVNGRTGENVIFAAVEKLAESHPKWGEVIMSRFNKGSYEVHSEGAPDEYDEYSSEICHGWLITSDQTDSIVASFARGERGNDVYDRECDGLHIWMQGDEISLQNENIVKAAKELISKSIGFGEFKRIIKEYA